MERFLLDCLSQELRNQITEDCSFLDIVNLAKAGAEIDKKTLSYAKKYAAIFKKMDYLDQVVEAGANPVLAGSDVRKDFESASKIHVHLLMVDFIGDSTYVSAKIRDCLQDHDLDLAHNAHIRGTNITVNICDAMDLCYAAVGTRDHSVYQSIDQLISDGVTAILPYTLPKEVQVIPIEIDLSRIDTYSPRPVVIRFDFEKYTLENPWNPGEKLEWSFVPEDESREGEEDHERYVGPGGRHRAIADEIARRS